MTAQPGPLNERIATMLKNNPSLRNIVQAPPGTDLEVWHIAARWADVPLRQLLADTAQVKSAHYAAALRVWESQRMAPLPEDEAAEIRGHALAAAGGPIADEISDASEIEEADPFARLMVLAEDAAKLTATARDGGDAVAAAKYSSFESELLQVAAALQIGTDIEMGK